MMTPFAIADSLRIGSLDFVSPDEIKVLIEMEAPSDVALNAGIPRPFPRINGYVIIPSESGFLVAQIEWITIERSQYPKRKGIQDFGIIDLPFPLRKMSLNPLGVLRENISQKKKEAYSFSRGVEIYPTVGDPVLLPSQNELKAIVESGDNRRVKIGVSPLAGNAVVSVDPDRLFGRHLAILGNTGSGKSCSVAGVIRWSIEAAKRENVCPECGQSPNINSRFIILDPNGEYSRAFRDFDNVRLYAVEAYEKDGIIAEQLQVPLWLWNTAEWCSFTRAGSGAQRPTLIQALRSVRDGQLEISPNPSTNMRGYLRSLISLYAIELNSGSPWAGGGRTKGFKESLSVWDKGLEVLDSFSETEKNAIEELKQAIVVLGNNNQSTGQNRDEWPKYTKPHAEELFRIMKKVYGDFGGTDHNVLPIDADVPRPFSGEQFIKSIEANAELMNTSQYVETMLVRIRTLFSDSRIKAITNCPSELTLEKWLDTYICPSNSSDGAITVIDLSLVPAEVVHIVTAVIARMTLEALQRYRRLNKGNTLPTTLVMEEAHTFIHKYASDADDTVASSMCTQVFEKIAREGRKFGLGLVLSSQRPSELSQTVLSQCNTFLLHRISNDRDQELVHKLVPDNLRGLLRELPSLPSRKAILMGWASELPVLVQMNFLEKQFQPQSEDPKYWGTWTDKSEASSIVDWNDIANDWQDITNGLSIGGLQTQIADCDRTEDEADEELPF